MTDYIDVYVSAGQNTDPNSPFYTFYLEDSATSQTITTLNTNAKYRFHRLNGATSHPFYISDTAAYQLPSNKIMIQGDGSPSLGITGTENFTLEFTGGPSGLPTSLYFFCTVSSHAMVGDFFELDLGKHTWVDNYYVINKHSSINKVKGNLVSGKHLYIQNNIDIKNTTNLTVQGNSKLIVASANSSEYTALTDGTSTTSGSINWAVSQYFSTGVASFLPGGTNESYGPIELWNTSQVTNMSSMFYDKSSFNEDITAWDVSKVTNFSQMFSGAKAFNQYIGAWTINGNGGKINMSSMFKTYQPTSNFSNLNIGNWERTGSTMANVASMKGMFTDNVKFNKPIGNWNISGCTDFYGMFYHAFAFYQDLSAWATTGGGFNATQYAGMLYSFENFLNQGSSSQIDRNGKLPIDVGYDADLLTLQTQVLGNGKFTVAGTDAGNGIPELINGAGTAPVAETWLAYNWPSIPKTELTDGTSTTSGSINWAVSEWFNDSTQFNAGGTYEEYGTIDQWNTSQVTNMSSLFYDKSSFNEDITAWDVSKVTNFYQMFYGATAFNQDIGAWTINGNGSEINMSFMFGTDFKPTTDYSNLNIENWERTSGQALPSDPNTNATSTSTMANVTSMKGMFINNVKFNKPIGNWNISGCKDFYGMFFSAFAFYQNLSAWATTGGGFNATQATGVLYSFKNFLNQGSSSQIDRNGKLPGDVGYDASLLTLQTKTLGGGNFTVAGTDAGNGIPELTTNDPQNSSGRPVTTTWQNYAWPSV